MKGNVNSRRLWELESFMKNRRKNVSLRKLNVTKILYVSDFERKKKELEAKHICINYHISSKSCMIV